MSRIKYPCEISRIQLENSMEMSYRALNTQQRNLNAKLVRTHPFLSPREGVWDLYQINSSK